LINSLEVEVTKIPKAKVSSTVVQCGEIHSHEIKWVTSYEIESD